MCTLKALIRSARLYQKNHPRLLEDLEAAAQTLREVLEKVPEVGVRVEGHTLWAAWAETSRGIEHAQPIELYDPRGELDGLAEDLGSRGIATIRFLPETHIGELDTLARMLNDGLQRFKLKRQGESDWAARLSTSGIASIKINEPLNPPARKDETILASLVASVLAYGSERTSEETVPREIDTREQLGQVLRLLEKLVGGAAQARSQAKDLAREFHAVLSGSGAETARQLVSVLSAHLPQENDASESYLTRLADATVLGFASREFQAGRLRAPALKEFFTRLAEEYSLPLGNGLALQGPGTPAAAWSSEGYGEDLFARFWAKLPSLTTSAVLRGQEAWCVPVETLRNFVQSLLDSRDRGTHETANPFGTREEARNLIVGYARCLEAERDDARSGVAAGLAELAETLKELWPHPESSGTAREFPQKLIDLLCGALSREKSHRIAGLLAAALERVARAAFDARDFRAFERVLCGLEEISMGQMAWGSSERSAAASIELAESVARRLVADERWMELVDAAVFGDAASRKRKDETRSGTLPRLLSRDPERLVDRLGLLLTTPAGDDAIPAMARLLGEVGQGVMKVLERRLSDSKHHRVAAAIKLLSATAPERLLGAIPRHLPRWDWGLQDLAISALARPLTREPVAGVTETFLATLRRAHPLVAPMMVDSIGLAAPSEGPDLLDAASDTLMEIAQGKEPGGTSLTEHKDVYLRIKAVEALGRIRADVAKELLVEIKTRRNGLTHAEPAGLRAAAEEALALIEGRAPSGGIGGVQPGLLATNQAYSRPRRYLRIPLSSPLEARILRPEPYRQSTEAHPNVARVRTISLGGAFVESEGKLAVGHPVRVEIRAGLRRIEGTAIVRNVTPAGSGLEFVHLSDTDREKLRRFVKRNSER